jgi:hypothetical protein
MTGLGDAAAIVTAATAVIAVAGSYVQFVLKRYVLPAEFEVEFTPYVRGSSQLIGEIALIVKNLGSTILTVTRVRSRIRFLLEADVELQAPQDLAEPWFFHNLASDIPDVGDAVLPQTNWTAGKRQAYPRLGSL